jgi:large subunit ribosomal protein L15
MKPKKNVRQRGGKTHGWGSMKKHRGAGNRGGRGNAGSGKRADHKKPSYWDNRKPMRPGQKRGQDYFGKHGFHSVTRMPTITINLRNLDQQVDSLLADKKIRKDGDSYTIDLQSLGIHKLLGTGKVTKKMHITVQHASPSAIEKIEAAGGRVN